MFWFVAINELLGALTKADKRAEFKQGFGFLSIGEKKVSENKKIKKLIRYIYIEGCKTYVLIKYKKIL